MLTQWEIDQARSQAKEWGPGGNKYRVVDRALSGAEGLLKMFHDEAGRPIDKATLYEAMSMQAALDKSNTNAEIEQIMVRKEGQRGNRYRLILTSFGDFDSEGVKPPELLCTAQQAITILGFLKLPEHWNDPGGEVEGDEPV
jgi:hypothetical protein